MTQDNDLKIVSDFTVPIISFIIEKARKEGITNTQLSSIALNIGANLCAHIVDPKLVKNHEKDYVDATVDNFQSLLEKTLYLKINTPEHFKNVDTTKPN